jgi:hypothetical protein
MAQVWICIAALAAVAGSAHAEPRCTQPYAPVIKASGPATAQELATLREDVKSFMAASDIYQQCVLSRGGANDIRISANQAQKVRVGQQFNEFVRAYRKANPS